MKSKRFDITILYNGHPSSTLDSALRFLAKKLGGRDTGAGFFFMNGGERDMAFCFNSESKAHKFDIEASKLVNKYHKEVIRNHGKDYRG